MIDSKNTDITDIIYIDDDSEEEEIKIENEEKINNDINLNSDNHLNTNANTNESKSNQNNTNNTENFQKSNNVSEDGGIKEIKIINNMNKSCGEIVKNEKEIYPDLRFAIAKNLDKLTDDGMIALLNYLEIISPQSIRILEDDTVYVNMESFSEDTFEKVDDFIGKII